MNSRRFPLFLILLFSALFAVGELYSQGGLSQKSKKDELKEKQLNEKDRERIRTSGILSMSVWKYGYNFGKPEKKGKLVSSVRYDARGNKAEETEYNLTDGSVLTKTSYRYDRRGNLIEEAKTKGETKTKTAHRYDSTGNKRETVFYRMDGSVDRKYQYIYDNDDNLVESLGYLADGHLFSRETFAYDGTGNLVENLTSLARFTYQYDEGGDMTEIVKYGRDFRTADSIVYKISDRMVFRYDSQQNLAGMDVYRSDSTLKARSAYSYDTQSNLISEVDLSAEGRPTYKVEYRYDKRGILIEDTGVDKGRPFRNTYKFDRRGNKKEWIAYDQVNEPRLMTKYIYERYSTLQRSESAEQSAQPEYVQPDTVDAHVVNGDLFQFLGCRIIASDGTYLGLVWADTSHPHSIVNAWGQYGFDGSPTSIFNPNCPYGGLKGVFSPFNRSCPSPPSLYREGKFVSYLSDNTTFNPCVSASRLMTFLMQQAKAKE